MNEWVGIGRLVRDPEIRHTGNGLAVANFTMAIDRPSKAGAEKKADFPPVTVWGKQAENCAKFLKKGVLVAVRGTVETGSYVNKDGATVYTVGINADRVEFLEWANGKKNDGSGESLNEDAPQSIVQEVLPTRNGFDQIDEENF